MPHDLLLQDLAPRLAAAAAAVRDAEHHLRAERELRRRLVVQAVDEGVMSQRQIAKALGGGPGLVHKILSAPEPAE